MWVLGSPPSSIPECLALHLFVSQTLRGEPLPTPRLASTSELWPRFVPRRVFRVHLLLVSVARLIMLTSAASRLEPVPVMP